MSAEEQTDRFGAHPRLPLASERRVVSVLFADIVGSMTILSQLDAEDAADFLETHVRLMLDGIDLFGGTTMKVQGDGIMAAFGASVAQEDHALRATLAGLTIVDRFSTLTPSPAYPAVRVRVGINSGPVIYHRLPGRNRQGQDMLGRTVHIAAHIEKTGAPNSVRLSQPTAELLREQILLEPCGDLTVDGLDTGLTLFEAAGIGQAAALTGAFQASQLAPLTGRASETATLKRFLAQTQRGEAPVLGLLGEGGIGKSRLCFEASMMARMRAISISEIRGIPIESATPFSAVRRLLETFFDGASEGGERALNIAERAGMSGLSEDEATALLAILDGPQREGRWAQLMPNERNQKIISAFVRFMLSLGQTQQTLLIAEDLHAFDAESRNCLNALMRTDHPARPALIATARPQGRALLDELHAAIVDLAPLAPEHADELVAHLLAASAGTRIEDAEIRAIAQRGAGVPLALQELARNRQAGSHGLSEDDGLPLSVETILQARLATLSNDAGQLAAAISATGGECPESLARRISSRAEAGFRHDLAELSEQQIVRSSANGDIHFAHQLLQEACYNQMLKRTRMAMHERIYRAYQEEPGLQASAQTLARHAAEAGNLHAAIDHLRVACNEAIRNHATESAADLFQDAFSILGRMPEDIAEQRNEFVLMAFDPFQQLARQGELIPALEQVREHCRSIGDPRREIQATLHLSAATWIDGQHKTALRLARDALAMARDREDLPIISYGQFILANVEFACGLPVSAVNRLGKLAASLTGQLGTARFGAISMMGVMSRAFASWYLSDLGRFDTAIETIAEAETLICDVDHPYSLLLTKVARGYRLLRMGDFEAAAHVLRDAHKLAIEGHFYGLEMSISGWRATALTQLGEPQTGLAITETSLESHWSSKVRNHGNFCVRESRAIAFSARGDQSLAHEEIEAAMAIAKRNYDPISYAYGLHTRGLIRRAGEDGFWRRDQRHARHLAQRIGLAPLQRQCEKELGDKL